MRCHRFPGDDHLTHPASRRTAGAHISQTNYSPVIDIARNGKKTYQRSTRGYFRLYFFVRAPFPFASHTSKYMAARVFGSTIANMLVVADDACLSKRLRERAFWGWLGTIEHLQHAFCLFRVESPYSFAAIVCVWPKCDCW